jgi:hypothetical protein
MSLDLAKKHLLDLQKTALDVVKSKGFDGVTAQVKVAMDISGSMGGYYGNGTVQETSDRLLALGMQFDVDKSIDVFAFDTKSHDVGSVNEQNFYGFVDRSLTRLVGGGTQYAPVMKDIIKSSDLPKATPVEAAKGLFGKLFGKKEAEVSTDTKATTPVFVMFITDGDNFDHAEAERVIREASNQPIFWKFVGIGHDNFAFLKKLDDMKGRFIDNANFVHIKDINKTSEEELYNLLLQEFDEWLVEAKAKGILA